MLIAAIQHDIVWEDAPANLDRLGPKVAAAAGAGARLVVLAEMFSTGFSMNIDVTAEPVMGRSATWMCEQAAANDTWICGSIPTGVQPGERPVNRLHLVSPTGGVHTYDKIHTFTYAGESEHFTAGTQTLTVDVEGLRVSPLVCFDLRFADLFWDLAAQTDCYLVPANWPEPRRRHWQALLAARAIENQAYVVGVNRVGQDGNGLAHAGDSAVIDPMGEVLASASTDEAVLLTEVDPRRVADIRSRLPFHADRRPR